MYLTSSIVFISHSPYRLLQYIIWYVRWVWKFDIKGMEYGPEEKVYLTRRILELSQTQWEVCTIYVTIQLRSDNYITQLWRH